VKDLNEGEIYRFHVVAINSYGRSGNSPILTTIAATYPGMKYTNEMFRPIVTTVDQNAMTISWVPPPSDTTGGSPITGYKVYSYIGVSYNTKTFPKPVKQEVQEIKVLGSSSVYGSFTALFRGSETESIKVSASSMDLKYALENLETINIISVSSSESGWRITFESEAGDLPLIETTSG